MEDGEFSLKQKFRYVLMLAFGFVLFLFAPSVHGYVGTWIVLDSKEIWNMMKNSEDHFEFYQNLRLRVIKSLVSEWFDRFEKTHYFTWEFNIHLSWEIKAGQYPDFYVEKTIGQEDQLDQEIRKYFLQNKDKIVNYFIYETAAELESLTVNKKTSEERKDIFLFKNKWDLKELWYVVSSYRLRTNNDAKYRIDNIYISYYNIGNTRLLNPTEEFSFMDEIHWDKNNPGDNIKLAYGLGTAGGVQSMYGGGICGGGFGFFWVSAVNKWIKVLERHNHTTRYRNLYDNQLNGKNAWFPGLDTSVYSFGNSRKDFRLKNIRNYPIILVMNYDRTKWWTEEVFTLGKMEDRGSFSYLGKRGSCYVWEFNGEEFKSCYGKLR